MTESFERLHLHQEQEAPGVISEFQYEYRFLSNMWILDTLIDTSEGPVETTEHAYQMYKFVDPVVRQEIATAINGIRAKKIADRLQNSGAIVVESWPEKKEALMLELNRQKYRNNPGLRQRLLDTGDSKLEEGNRWGDTFWGISPPNSGIGENKLGKILEQIRDELRAES